MPERLGAMARLALEDARRPLGDRGKQLLFLCTSPAREGVSGEDLSALENAVALAPPGRPIRRAGAASFFSALEEAGNRLGGDVTSVAILAVDSSVSIRALTAHRELDESPFRRGGPFPAEAAAPVVVMKAGDAARQKIDVLGTVSAAAVAPSSSHDDNDVIVDGAALTSLLRAPGSVSGIGRVFGQHNVDSLRHLEWTYAAARNARLFRPEPLFTCVEDELGAVGAAAGALHFVYGLAVDRHGTAPRGQGEPSLPSASSRSARAAPS
jgi:hypothetical protein